MVLGGLRKKEVSDQKNKIPLLGDIPIIENLFKFQSQETIFSEVVVFITPYIIENPVLSEEERKIYESTHFQGPCATLTELESDSPCFKN
jgi:type II secretory pathway component GspD/PulD (secretin)